MNASNLPTLQQARHNAKLFMAHEAAAVSVVINFLSAAGVAKKATIHRDGTMTGVRKL
jgi:hypothetical protein